MQNHKVQSTASVLREECTALGKSFKFSEKSLAPQADLIETQNVLAAASDGIGNAAPLTALCISGGGIRSATFNLGVVQELARLEMLGKFDYLSTVSGGGYLGSWLSAWIQRSRTGCTFFEGQYATTKVSNELQRPTEKESEEAPPLRHLRAYSNYLSPQKGLFSADTWALIAIWLRNTLLNWLVLIPIFMAVLLVPRLHAWVIQLPYGWNWWIPAITAGVLVLMSVCYVVLNLPNVAKTKKSQGEGAFLWFCLLPAILAGLIATSAVFAYCYQHDIGTLPILVTVVPPAIWMLLFGVMTLITAMLSGLEEKCWLFSDPGDQSREWSARAGAWLLIVSIGWLALCGVVIWLPAVMLMIVEKLYVVFSAGGLAAVITVLLGKSESTAATIQKARQLLREGESSSLVNISLPVAASVFIVIFLSGLSLLNARVLNSLYDPCSDLLCAITSQNPLCLMLALMVISFGFGQFIHVNKFSIHSLYRNRLMRAYLGASRFSCIEDEPNPRFCPPEDDGKCGNNLRKPNRFTGFDQKDNLFMKELQNQKPFLVVNTALNLVHGRQLAWQDRKAESFTISPLHAGSSAMEQMQGCYRPVDEYTGNDGLTLATAMSISGAAASPNMGYQSSPALAFVMALFNVRLGWWIGNPKLESYKKAGPRASRFQLVREALGLTDDDGKWVYLSDGGHFENLGLYEMVLRRCRYIVLCDAGADLKFIYEDLGNAIQKIRVDLGVEITLEEGSTLPSGKRNGKPLHFAHLNINYKKIHGDEVENGKILYIKPAFYDDEPETPVDVFHYAQGSENFPHETTADQFFSESQFESYRQLGIFTMRHFCDELRGKSIKDLVGCKPQQHANA